MIRLARAGRAIAILTAAALFVVNIYWTFSTEPGSSHDDLVLWFKRVIMSSVVFCFVLALTDMFGYAPTKDTALSRSINYTAFAGMAISYGCFGFTVLRYWGIIIAGAMMYYVWRVSKIKPREPKPDDV